MDEETPPNNAHSEEPPRSKRTLEFITFNNPNAARTDSNKQRVRSQAMRDFHRRSTGQKRRKNEIELDVTPLLQGSAPQFEGEVSNKANYESNQARRLDDGSSSSLVTTLSVSRLDPFFQYPIRMGHRERELYDHRKLRLLIILYV